MNLRSLFLMVALPLAVVVAAALLLTPRDILRQPVLPGEENNSAGLYTSSVARPASIPVVEFEETAIQPAELVVVATPVDAAPADAPLQQPNEIDRRWTTARGLNVRTGPSVQEQLIGSLPFGTPVEVLDTSGTWANVRAGDMTGWLSANFLTREDPSAN